MHIVAGGSRGPRVAVRVVNQRLAYPGAETVEKSSRYSCSIMIHRKRKRVGKGPGVCNRIVDLNCGRRSTPFVVTAEDVHFAVSVYQSRAPVASPASGRVFPKRHHLEFCRCWGTQSTTAEQKWEPQNSVAPSFDSIFSAGKRTPSSQLAMTVFT